MGHMTLYELKDTWYYANNPFNYFDCSVQSGQRGDIEYRKKNGSQQRIKEPMIKPEIYDY